MSRRHTLALALFSAMAAPATARAVASAELYRIEPEFQGRFEARIRYAAGDGVISSFFLWKEGSEVSGTFWNELDFEKLGADCHMQTNTLYGNPVMGDEQAHTMPPDMCGAYHDYRFEWTPSYLAWFIDEREIRRETGAVVAAFADNARGGMRVHFNVWPGNADFGGNFSPSILPVRQYISWVQYSAYRNGGFELEWREDFNGAGLPNGWATGEWESPLGLSTHQPANVTFTNGIAVLSLTADGATGFTGTPPADGASGASGAGGGANGGAATGGSTTGGSTTGGAGASGGTNGGATASGGATGGSTIGGATATGGSTIGGAAAGTAGTSTPGGAAGHANAGTTQGGASNGGAANPPNPPGGATASGAPSSSGAGLGSVNGGGANASSDASGCGCRTGSAGHSGSLSVALWLALAASLRRRASRVAKQ